MSSTNYFCISMSCWYGDKTSRIVLLHSLLIPQHVTLSLTYSGESCTNN